MNSTISWLELQAPKIRDIFERKSDADKVVMLQTMIKKQSLRRPNVSHPERMSMKDKVTKFSGLQNQTI